MTQSKSVTHNRKVRLCQLVALQHVVEPLITTAQIATRQNVDKKTIRNWLRRGRDTPVSFKDGNEWVVRISDYKKWEKASNN
jgi:transposase